MGCGCVFGVVVWELGEVICCVCFGCGLLVVFSWYMVLLFSCVCRCLCRCLSGMVCLGCMLNRLCCLGMNGGSLLVCRCSYFIG